jgi:hypothetical protein
VRVRHIPFLKRHIDLDSITSITDIEIVRLHVYQWELTFSIDLKLHDNPIRYHRSLVDNVDYRTSRDDCTGGITLPMYENGEEVWKWIPGNQIPRTDLSPFIPVKKLQKDIDWLIEQWKDYPPLFPDENARYHM